MKTEPLIKNILLEQSGERPAGRTPDSPEARVLRRELETLRAAVYRPDLPLSPGTAARIDARLRRRPVRIAFHAAWKPALALAACLTLLVGFWNLQQGRNSWMAPAVSAAADADAVWQDPIEDDLIRLEQLAAADVGDPLAGFEL